MRQLAQNHRHGASTKLTSPKVLKLIVAVIVVAAIVATITSASLTTLGAVRSSTSASAEDSNTVEIQGNTLVLTDCHTDSRYYTLAVASLQYAAPTSQSLAGTHVSLSLESKSSLTVQWNTYQGERYSGSSRNQKLAALDDIAFLGESSVVKITITITDQDPKDEEGAGHMSLNIFETYAQYVKFGNGAVNESSVQFSINATINASTTITVTNYTRKDGLYFYGVFTPNAQSFTYNYTVHRASYEKPKSFSCTLTSAESSTCSLNTSRSAGSDVCLIAYTEPGGDISDPFYTVDITKSGKHKVELNWEIYTGIGLFVLVIVLAAVACFGLIVYRREWIRQRIQSWQRI